jgi:pyruvate kinase
LEISTDYAVEGDSNKIACNYKNLPASVSIGSTVCIGDGVVQGEVIEVGEVSSNSKVSA